MKRWFLFSGILFFLPSLLLSQYADNTPSLGSVRPSGLVHMLDIKLAGDIAYTGGAGGLWILDIHDLRSPAILSQISSRSRGAIYRLTRLGNYLYTFQRNAGIQIFDVSNPSSPQKKGIYHHSGSESYEHGLVHGGFLYISAHDDGILVVDVSSPLSPQFRTRVATTNAFAARVSGDFLFVADGEAGLTVIEIRNPLAPRKVTTRATTALAQDLVLDGNYAYLAVGSAGMDIFDITRPEAPVFLGNYHMDGFTTRLQVTNGFAYLANWETVEIVDVSDPRSPHLVGTQHAFQRAMVVAVRDSTFFVGDWSTFRIYQHKSFPVPDINTDPIELAFGSIDVGSKQTLPLTIENLGQEPLSITDISAHGNGFSVESAAFTLEPFASRTITVTYRPVTPDQVTGNVRIRSNDPDEGEKSVPLTGGSRSVGVGDEPTDFTLPDLSGTVYHLQEYINQGLVIVLAFYASW